MTLVPIGGLCNRMRAILSALTLCEELGESLYIIWTRDKGLNAKYRDLFLPIPGVSLTEADSLRKFAYALPRKRNAYLPWLFQSTHYRRVFTESRLLSLLTRPEEIKNLCYNKSTLFITGLGFYPANDERLATLFQPIPILQKQIARRTAQLGKSCMGLHIRRTDNAVAIQKSPTESFVQAMEEAETQRFYVATDDDDVKQMLKERFGSRLHMSPYSASRSTVEGMQEAVVELFTLANTDPFRGSCYSSYSDTVEALRRK